MTNAREIISNALARAKHDDHPNWTGFIMNQLDRAGFRILGPDEVDPVTLERAAKVAESHMLEADDNEEPGDDDWWTRSAANGQATVIAAAIRALGRKA